MTDSRPLSLDELVEKDRQYRAKVAACSHQWGPPWMHSFTLGQSCFVCGVSEVPWYKGETERLRSALTLLRPLIRESVDDGALNPAYAERILECIDAALKVPGTEAKP